MDQATKLTPALETVAHELATGLVRSVREAAERNSIAPSTVYTALSRDPRIREAFNARVIEHRDRRADKAEELLRRSERLAARSIDAADARPLDPLSGMQVAALGTKVAAEIRSQLGDERDHRPAAEAIDRMASRIRRGIIRAIAAALADPARAEATMRRLMDLDIRRRMTDRASPSGATRRAKLR